MELAPLVVTGTTMALTSLNAYLLRRQSGRLQMLEKRSEIGTHQIENILREKDEVVTYIYKLYNIASELDQILSTIVSPSYQPVSDHQGLMRTAAFYVYYEHDASAWIDAYHRNANHVMGCKPRFHVRYSLHADVNSYIYAISQLFRWIEIKKTNRTAIHAFHTGPLHIAVDNLSRFLHGTSERRLRVALLRQKGIGQNLKPRRSEDDDDAVVKEEFMNSEVFYARLCAWKELVPRSEKCGGGTGSLPQRKQKKKRASSDILVLSTSDTFAYLIRSRATKHVLLRHYEFNNHFYALHQDINDLFVAVQKEKDIFNTHDYTALLIFILTRVLRKCMRCFHFCNRVTIRALRNLHREAYNKSRRENRLHPLVQVRFLNMIRHRRYRQELLTAMRYIQSYAVGGIKRLTQRLQAVYRPLLFEAFLSKDYCELCDFIGMIRNLIAETDRMIQADLLFREQFMKT
jgi:hypothetical protein